MRKRQRTTDAHSGSGGLPSPLRDGNARPAPAGGEQSPGPAPSGPSALSPQALRALQRTAGNSAVARALDRRPLTESPAGPDRTGRRPAVPSTIAEHGNPGRRATRRPVGTLPAIGERPAPGSRRTRTPRAPAAPAVAIPLGLPPYLRELAAPGLSTTYGLTGHAFVTERLAEVTGTAEGTVAEIGKELTGRPESFYGRGRAFSVQGADGRGWYEVTVGIGPEPMEQPPVFAPPAPKQDTAAAEERAAFQAHLDLMLGNSPDGNGGGDEDPPAADPAADPAARRKAARDAVDAATKVDVQHNTTGSAGRTAARSSSKGVNFTAFGLAPVAPAVWAGAAGTVNAQPFQSSQDARATRAMSEPRVLRSDGGSVEVLRRVRYTVRIQPEHGGGPRLLSAPGGLTQRVPREHLVPVTREAPVTASAAPLSAAAARRVRLADSLAPVAATDSGAPHAGGNGLFDAVRSVLHPSLTAHGAPGRSWLHETTSPSTVVDDLPRMLAGWVTGQDLVAKGGKVRGTYRIRAGITSMAPAWGTGKTQLRTHQQAQHGLSGTASGGRGVAVGVGPAAAFGVLANAAAVRGTVMPVAGVRKARFSAAEQNVSSRQGAEVRGEKVLYRCSVHFTVEGGGPAAPEQRLRPGLRTAAHSMDVWMSLRADEAASLGLPLPAGVSAGPMVERPERADAAGADRATGPGEESSRERRSTERHLPFGALGSNVTISQVDSEPLLSAIERLFATDARLAGYLPGFGPAARQVPGRKEPGGEEAETLQTNYRELLTVLSGTNLRVNKDQLLGDGIRVRMRRKSRMHAHDVQIRVTGELLPQDDHDASPAYRGEVKDWLVRSHATVATGGQSGRSSSRSLGGMVLVQGQLAPGVLTGSLRADRTRRSARREQGGPVTRTDVLTNGSETASVFSGRMRLSVDVTLTERQRTARRAVAPGTPGRDVAEPRAITSSADNELLALETQDVRLFTPTEFTLDGDEKERLDRRTGARRSTAAAADNLAAGGIGDLAALDPAPDGGTRVRDWKLVETVGDGRAIRDLAFRLLSRAATRGEPGRQDTALETEGLAPRLTIEEQFSPQAITSSLRQAVSAGRVVKNLRYARRLAALDGAVGTRFALLNPELIHKGAGPGTETFVLGGHQVTGQRGTDVTTGGQGGLTGLENGAEWRLAQSVSGGGSVSDTTTTASVLSGTVDRNAHTARKQPLYLVLCDLAVGMVAEVKATGGGPHVAAGRQVLPASVAVWLTESQLRDVLPDALPPAERAKNSTAADGSSAPQKKTKDPAQPEQETEQTKGKEKGKQTETETETGTGTGTGNTTGPPAGRLPRNLPLGFGTLERMPDFVPLLTDLRSNLRRGDSSLADEVLPKRQLDDRYDNVQRLLRVLDRDGAAGLLSGAMDGGVTVELLRHRSTPCWAVFTVERTGPGVATEEVNGGGDMEYITAAVAQVADSRERTVRRGVEGVLGGFGKPDGGSGTVKSAGAIGGAALGTSDSVKTATVTRGQIGVKTVAEGAAPSVLMSVPVTARLTLFKGGTRVGYAQHAGGEIVHRVLTADLKALSKLPERPDPALPPPPASATGAAEATEDRIRDWRAQGVALPVEAQVNGFRGAPRLRAEIDTAVRQAGGVERFNQQGQAAAYARKEAVSTEWLIAALPLLVSSGVDLPPVHATGVIGQDLSTSLHGRLRDGRVLGAGDKMTFETVWQNATDAPRAGGADSQSSAEHSRTARGMFGPGVLEAGPFRMNQLVGNADRVGGATDASANGAGSLPLHKPKDRAVLVSFTLDVRVVARVASRGFGHGESVAVRDLTVVAPVVVRMPAHAVRTMLEDPGNAARLHDPEMLLPDGT
ncbi:hypothetical protein ACFP51_00475 [Streptomyces pratens]|uniref:Uncharacterized protein n=1 Tax=Streptomyces pratens TaxID=887456 RepID=A0ABW1LTS5_9ACTN